MGVNLGIIEKSGAWFYYDGNRLAQGKDNARAAIENDPALEAEIEAKIKEKAEAVDAEKPEEEDIELDDEALDIRTLDLGEDEDEAIPTNLMVDGE